MYILGIDVWVGIYFHGSFMVAIKCSSTQNTQQLFQNDLKHSESGKIGKSCKLPIRAVVMKLWDEQFFFNLNFLFFFYIDLYKPALMKNKTQLFNINIGAVVALLQ